MTPYLRSTRPTLTRLSVPAPEPNPRRRPHGAATIEAIGRLVTTTTLPLREIARRTGASLATVSRKARRHGWLRPDSGYPEETITAAGQRAARRAEIVETILAQADELLFRREMNPNAKLRQLTAAARLVRLARKLDEEERAATRRRKPGRKKPPPDPLEGIRLSAYEVELPPKG